MDDTPSKLIKTKAKGTLLLVPSSEEQDERILLISLSSSFRGSYSRTGYVGAEEMYSAHSGYALMSTSQRIIRLKQPDGFFYAETGNKNRSSRGLVEIFGWNSYRTMSTTEFDAWMELEGHVAS